MIKLTPKCCQRGTKNVRSYLFLIFRQYVCHFGAEKCSHYKGTFDIPSVSIIVRETARKNKRATASVFSITQINIIKCDEICMRNAARSIKCLNKT